MLKKYEVENIIIDSLIDLDRSLSKSVDENGMHTVCESKVTKNDNGDLILEFKEDYSSNSAPDKYIIKIEYIE